jgi:cobalt-zinc-cadmium efflux system outer membrane protein
MMTRSLLWLACLAGCLAGSAGGVLALEGDATPPPPLTLEQFLGIAPGSHPALAAASRSIEESLAGVDIASAWPNPRLEGALGHSRSLVDDPSGSELSFRLGLPFPWPGRRRAAVDAEQAAVEATRRGADRTEADLRVDLSLLFLDAYLSQREAVVLGESAEALESLAALVRRRADTGEGRPADALRSEAEAGRARQQALTAADRADALYAQMRLAAGGDLPPAARLDLPDAEFPDLPPLDELLDLLDSRNPSLRETQAREAEAGLRVEAERRRWWPDLEASVFRDRETDKVATGGALMLDVPVFWRNRGGVARAQAQARRLQEERRLQRLRAAQELLTAHAAWRAAGRLRRAYDQDVLPSARRALEIAEFSLRQGEASLLETLDSRRGWLASALEAEEARVEEVRQRVRVERLVGRSTR